MGRTIIISMNQIVSAKGARACPGLGFNHMVASAEGFEISLGFRVLGFRERV